MYEVFKTFISTETWHTSHPNDEERFYTALHQIVRNPDFNADQLGEWLESQVPAARREELSEWRSRAWAVYDYLKYTKQL